MEFTTYTLPNGIRGIHRRIKGNVTHCALLVNAGSRDELKHQFGLAHFTEHALFKGTEHRKAYQVNCRLENLGGELNAFTTKEDTTIHATTLRSDFSKAVELIADVAFHSTFPDRELEKEKEIIYDEINTYKDSPADMIYDTFEEMLFAGSELGHNILGRKSSLARFSGESIREFVARTHTTDQMVFSSIGNLSAKSVETTVARYLSGIESSARDFSASLALNSLFILFISKFASFAFRCERAPIEEEKILPIMPKIANWHEQESKLSIRRATSARSSTGRSFTTCVL